MSVSETGLPPLPHGMQKATLRLPSYPNSPLTYHYLPPSSSSSSSPLCIFINGLGLPQAGWLPAIHSLLSQPAFAGPDSRPGVLTFDRFGQGQSPSLSPEDVKDPSKPAHVPLQIVYYMNELFRHFISLDGNHSRRVIIIANSIGCPLTRLYLKHLGLGIDIAGIIFLDSMIANSDFLNDIWPDPDSSCFDAAQMLPEGVTVDQLRETRMKVHRVFSPNMPNREGLDRSRMREILPHANEPKLPGDPVLYVVGHDPEVFAQSMEMNFGCPQSLCLRYAQKAWAGYNRGLTELSSRSRKEVIIAKGADHFIQKDKPELVAKLIVEMMDEL